MTPTTTQEFQCVMSSENLIGCMVKSRFQQIPLFELSDTKINVPVIEENTVNVEEIAYEQSQRINERTSEFDDIFASTDTEIGLFPNLEMEITNRAIKCKPYRATEPDREFIRNQIQNGVTLEFVETCFEVKSRRHRTFRSKENIGQITCTLLVVFRSLRH
jgi:hypothetical protein